MSQGKPQQQHDSSLNRHEPRELARSEFGERRQQFTGFTSPYKRLKEQEEIGRHGGGPRTLYGKQDQSLLNRYLASPQPSIAASIRNSRLSAASMNVNQFNQDTSLKTDVSAPHKAYEHERSWNSVDHHNNQKWRPRHEDHSRNINARYHSSSPSSHHYTKESEMNARDFRETKRAPDESVYGKVTWEYNMPQQSQNYTFNDRPINSQDFREQCRKTYVRASSERQRNAEHGLWSKCNWATYADRPGRFVPYER